ncbi:hypothetical protein TWF481_006138 [Arthrobotrys musiformis]|uniref:C2H2-type domain-containing protein n=1 Tax=Arthrobotrys musiformis TaxID=47236 RepID=A0AAV9WFV2_9PEZI
MCICIPSRNRVQRKQTVSETRNQTPFLPSKSPFSQKLFATGAGGEGCRLYGRQNASGELTRMASNASAPLLPLPVSVSHIPPPPQGTIIIPPQILRTPPSTPSIQEILTTSTKLELQNYLSALLSSDPRNKSRLQSYHKKCSTLTATKRLLQQPPQLPAANSTRKRKAESQILICITCFASYDEADNHVEACRYHPGRWEADLEHDVWGDVDENDPREPEHEDFFNDVPEAFIMDCCGGRGDSAGCVVDRHVSGFGGEGNGSGGIPLSPRHRRRRRVVEPERYEEDEEEDEY